MKTLSVLLLSWLVSCVTPVGEDSSQETPDDPTWTTDDERRPLPLELGAELNAWGVPGLRHAEVLLTRRAVIPPPETFATRSFLEGLLPAFTASNPDPSLDLSIVPLESGNGLHLLVARLALPPSVTPQKALHFQAIVDSSPSMASNDLPSRVTAFLTGFRAQLTEGETLTFATLDTALVPVAAEASDDAALTELAARLTDASSDARFSPDALIDEVLEPRATATQEFATSRILLLTDGGFSLPSTEAARLQRLLDITTAKGLYLLVIDLGDDGSSAALATLARGSDALVYPFPALPSTGDFEHLHHLLSAPGQRVGLTVHYPAGVSLDRPEFTPGRTYQPSSTLLAGRPLPSGSSVTVCQEFRQAELGSLSLHTSFEGWEDSSSDRSYDGPALVPAQGSTTFKTVRLADQLGRSLRALAEAYDRSDLTKAREHLQAFEKSLAAAKTKYAGPFLTRLEALSGHLDAALLAAEATPDLSVPENTASADSSVPEDASEDEGEL